MENNRRNFIKKLSAFSASAALISAAPMVAAAEKFSNDDEIDEAGKSFVISILQTTDVHCQIHPHD